MIAYRIYQLDETDRIAGVIEHDCPDDQAALAMARQILEPDTVLEVWQRARCLGKVHGGKLAQDRRERTV